ncbi:hypothetical protein, partial [Klebsiella pneumoniae]|uniref:hypothetical protein n=1 Tax=Klebsiella pneumoniae TaxID=573 RepID=UPI001953FDF0
MPDPPRLALFSFSLPGLIFSLPVVYPTRHASRQGKPLFPPQRDVRMLIYPRLRGKLAAEFIAERALG